MSHWLDAEEQSHSTNTKGHKHSLRDKVGEVENNYAQVSGKYKDFLEDLYNLIDRVNSLPLVSRADFGSIDGREKDSKLNNCLNIFSSSRRKYNASFLDFLHFSKKRRYKNIRVAFFNVSTRQGMIDVEVKERTLLRLSHEVDKPAENADRGVNRQAHIVTSLPVEMLDHDFALGVIDWLAFKQDSTNSTIIKALEQSGLRKK